MQWEIGRWLLALCNSNLPCVAKLDFDSGSPVVWPDISGLVSWKLKNKVNCLPPSDGQSSAHCFHVCTEHLLAGFVRWHTDHESSCSHKVKPHTIISCFLLSYICLCTPDWLPWKYCNWHLRYSWSFLHFLQNFPLAQWNITLGASRNNQTTIKVIRDCFLKAWTAATFSSKTFFFHRRREECQIDGSFINIKSRMLQCF